MQQKKHSNIIRLRIFEKKLNKILLKKVEQKRKAFLAAQRRKYT